MKKENKKGLVLEIKKKHLIIISLFFIIPSILILVNAWGGDDPFYVGHSVNEINWTGDVEINSLNVEGKIFVENGEDKQEAITKTEVDDAESEYFTSTKLGQYDGFSCETKSAKLICYKYGYIGSVGCGSKTMVGGGCRFNHGDGHRKISENLPYGNGWRCVTSFGNGDWDEDWDNEKRCDEHDGAMYVYARCCGFE